ncbi:hypothetical protein EYF80_058210 [Liparis tanakae]|uniref:Uncharacterized protein n=1 Tax=Liparis tanakae TaxID=230148 RepID=A0A4Z2ES78_9TELE|nr:hypothetical protein EYF80_058210 [Liparis tanakae]
METTASGRREEAERKLRRTRVRKRRKRYRIRFHAERAASASARCGQDNLEREEKTTNTPMQLKA